MESHKIPWFLTTRLSLYLSKTSGHGTSLVIHLRHLRIKAWSGDPPNLDVLKWPTFTNAIGCSALFRDSNVRKKTTTTWGLFWIEIGRTIWNMIMVNSCEFIFQLLESQSLTLTQSADPAMDLALMGPTWSHYDTFHLPGVKGNPGFLLKKNLRFVSCRLFLQPILGVQWWRPMSRGGHMKASNLSKASQGYAPRRGKNNSTILN